MRESRPMNAAAAFQSRFTRVACVCLCSSLVVATVARGDRIILRGGGVIRGKILPGNAPDRVNVLTATGKVPVSMQKKQVEKVEKEASPLDEYLERRAKVAQTAASQYELGAWCEKNKLSGPARVHYEQALAADASFGPAHKKLGHILLGNHWLTYDQAREAQGLVKYKGKWVTIEEKEELEARTAITAEQRSTARQIRALRPALTSGDEKRRAAAEESLRALDSPKAVQPLLSVLGDDESPEVRILLARLLGEIAGPEASAALVTRILSETDDAVRRETMLEISRREDASIPKRLVRALGSSNPPVVNRAAWTLGNLDAKEAVPSLVGALITRQTRMVIDPGDSANGNAGMGSIGPGPAPVAFNGSSAGYLTPPAVTPGIIAFGATSSPIYPLMPSPLIMNPAPRGPEPKLVTVSYQNSEVLASLVKMTGVNLGYNIANWRSWLTASFRSEPRPVKRVPEP